MAIKKTATGPLALPEVNTQAYNPQFPTVPAPTIPAVEEFKWPGATELVGQSAGAITQNAPALQQISSIVNAINQQAQQQANLARTGGNAAYDQSILDNINRMAQGYISPETMGEAQLASAQRWGGAGFGVDTPAAQSAVRRALGLQREEMARQAASDYDAYIKSHPSAPIVSIDKYTVTPEALASYQAQQAEDAMRAAQLRQEASKFQYQAGLDSARLQQERAMQEQRLAQDRALTEAGRQQDAALKLLALQQAQDAARANAYAASYKDLYPEAMKQVNVMPTQIRSDWDAQDFERRVAEARQNALRRTMAPLAGAYRPVDYASLYSQMV